MFIFSTAILSLSKETLNEFNILSFGIILRHSLVSFPGIPFTSSFESGHHTWLLGGVVTLLSLFEETIDLSFLLIAEVWFGISDLLGVGFEISLKSHDVQDQNEKRLLTIFWLLC